MVQLTVVYRKNLLFFFLFCLLMIPAVNTPALFTSVETIEDARIKRIAVSPLDENLIYVGSDKAIFRSKDRGINFEKIYVFKDEDLTDIAFDPHAADICFVSATRHVYKVSDKIERIFSAPEEERVLSVAKYKSEIYLGTSAGLYYICEDILKWQKIGGLISGVTVYCIAASDYGLYLATNKGVYFLKDKNNLERLFVIREKEITVEEESGLMPNIIKVDIFDKNKLWLGTNKGLFMSPDKGKTWNKIYAGAVSNVIIYSIAQTSQEKNSLYLGSSKGFFRVDLKTNDAKKISEGIYSNEIFWAAFSNEGEIYLATAKGLFKDVYFSAPSNSRVLQEILAKEPSIYEVQQAAMRYNETDPNKIRRWRNALRVRALFPTVKLDYDKTITTALGATYDRVQVGPRDWGLSFSWDVGDLIWNTHEDDIDTRSRLNTQLRLDILDEINRVYFERLRLKKEIGRNNLSQEDLSQKDLRLQELTAIIDGYTGGYFSKRLAELAN